MIIGPTAGRLGDAGPTSFSRRHAAGLLGHRCGARLGHVRVLDEVLEAARQQGVDDLAKIRLAVLEVSGTISIIST
jgi:hypothetical protein